MSVRGIDIAIVGGGMSGLYTLKHLLEAMRSGGSARASTALDDAVAVFESSDGIGGVWRYQPNAAGGVHRSTHTTSSKHFMQISDFPFPESTPEFPHHTAVYRHLKRYASHFGLVRHIRFGHAVQWIERIDCKSSAHQTSIQIAGSESTAVEEPIVVSGGDTGGSGGSPSHSYRWRLHFKPPATGGDSIPVRPPLQPVLCKRLIICSGASTVPYAPTAAPSVFSAYSGPALHSHSYKFADPKLFAGKSVLIIGGGENASDIACEISSVARRVVMSIRSGQWFQDRLLGGPNYPADMTATVLGTQFPSVIHRALIPFTQPMMEEWWGTAGSSIPEWQPAATHGNSEWGGSFFNKSRSALMTAISFGRVIPKRAVDGIITASTAQQDSAEVHPVIDGGGGSSGHANKKYRFHFAGDASDQYTDIDLVVYCTGYRSADFPFFDHQNRPKSLDAASASPSISAESKSVPPSSKVDCNPRSRYQLIFSVSDPYRLAFVGFIRPNIGSIPMCVELQARAVAHAWCHAESPEDDEIGALPSTADGKMQKLIEMDWAERAKRFPYDVGGGGGGGRAVRPSLVDPFRYCMQLAQSIGAAPDWLDAFATSPLRTMSVAVSPFSPFLFRCWYGNGTGSGGGGGGINKPLKPSNHHHYSKQNQSIEITAVNANVTDHSVAGVERATDLVLPTKSELEAEWQSILHLIALSGSDRFDRLVLQHPMSKRIRHKTIATACYVLPCLLVICHWFYLVWKCWL